DTLRTRVTLRAGRARRPGRTGRTSRAGVALRAGRAHRPCRTGRTGVALRSLRPWRPLWSCLAPADPDLRRPAAVAGAGVDHTQVADVLLVAAVDDSARVGNRRKRDAPANGTHDHADKQPARPSKCESAHRAPLSSGGGRTPRYWT